MRFYKGKILDFLRCILENAEGKHEKYSRKSQNYSKHN